jgi:hypothetical protein
MPLCLPIAKAISWCLIFCADAMLSVVPGHTTPTQGDELFRDLRLVSLEKQLNIELKVIFKGLIFHLKFFLPKAPLLNAAYFYGSVPCKLQHVIEYGAADLPTKGMAAVHGYRTTGSHSSCGFCCISKQDTISILLTTKSQLLTYPLL